MNRLPIILAFFHGMFFVLAWVGVVLFHNMDAGYLPILCGIASMLPVMAVRELILDYGLTAEDEEIDEFFA